MSALEWVLVHSRVDVKCLVIFVSSFSMYCVLAVPLYLSLSPAPTTVSLSFGFDRCHCLRERSWCLIVLLVLPHLSLVTASYHLYWRSRYPPVLDFLVTFLPPLCPFGHIVAVMSTAGATVKILRLLPPGYLPHPCQWCQHGLSSPRPSFMFLRLSDLSPFLPPALPPKSISLSVDGAAILSLPCLLLRCQFLLLLAPYMLAYDSLPPLCFCSLNLPRDDGRGHDTR